MRGWVDFKHLGLSPSEQGVVRRWSRVMVAIYASLALGGLVLAVATSGLPRDHVAAHKAPPFVIVDLN